MVGHFPPDSDPSPRPKSVQSTPGQLHPPCSRASSPRRPSGRHVDRAPSGGERAMSTTPQRWRWRRRACGRRQAAAGPFSLGGQAHCVGCARVVCRAAVIIGQGCRPTGVNFQESSSPCLRPTAPCGANMGMGGGRGPSLSVSRRAGGREGGRGHSLPSRGPHAHSRVVQLGAHDTHHTHNAQQLHHATGVPGHRQHQAPGSAARIWQGMLPDVAV